MSLVPKIEEHCVKQEMDVVSGDLPKRIDLNELRVQMIIQCINTEEFNQTTHTIFGMNLHYDVKEGNKVILTDIAYREYRAIVEAMKNVGLKIDFKMVCLSQTR